LLASGRLTVDQKLAIPLDGGRTVAILRVDLAPGVAEPRHTHPGHEILYGLEGTGFVEVDGREPIPITPDTAIQIERGQAKALRNRSDVGPFSVLAVLILDRDQPALTTVD
jgi:quercetin dioxygenase-like cupin family protein